MPQGVFPQQQVRSSRFQRFVSLPEPRIRFLAESWSFRGGSASRFRLAHLREPDDELFLFGEGGFKKRSRLDGVVSNPNSLTVGLRATGYCLGNSVCSTTRVGSWRSHRGSSRELEYMLDSDL